MYLVYKLEHYEISETTTPYFCSIRIPCKYHPSQRVIVKQGRQIHAKNPREDPG
jgi:hypothetical protein